MRSYFLAGACAASMLLVLTPIAEAADVDMGPAPSSWNWYVSVFGGWSLPNDVELDAVIPPGGTPAHADLDIDDGFTAGAALGLRFNDWIRAEAEISGNWHDPDKAVQTVGGGGPTTYDNLDGDVDALFLLHNIWVDIPIWDALHPYFGGGAGVGRLSADISDANTNYFDDSDWSFAYQLGGGLGFDLSEAITIDIGYRFKVLHGADLTNQNNYTSEWDYESHNIIAGLRINLGALGW
jgi:opacity protein-like surface antigen